MTVGVRSVIRPGGGGMSGYEASVASAPARKILKIGMLFFVLQLATAVGYESDNIVIAQLLGAEQVSQYAIPLKLFMFVPLLVGFGYSALWPAYGEAIARGEKHSGEVHTARYQASVGSAGAVIGHFGRDAVKTGPLLSDPNEVPGIGAR